jgi:hypothetical protein
MNIRHLDDGSVEITETVAEYNKRFTDNGMVAPIVLIPRMPDLHLSRLKLALLEHGLLTGTYYGRVTRMTIEQFKEMYPNDHSEKS